MEQDTPSIAVRLRWGGMHFLEKTKIQRFLLTSSYYKVVVIRVPLQGQNATIDKELWIGINLLPQDGFGKAPTTALCF